MRKVFNPIKRIIRPSIKNYDEYKLYSYYAIDKNGEGFFYKCLPLLGKKEWLNVFTFSSQENSIFYKRHNFWYRLWWRYSLQKL